MTSLYSHDIILLLFEWRINQEKYLVHRRLEPGYLRIRTVWPESSLSTWRNLTSRLSKMRPVKILIRLILIFAGRTCPKVRFRTLWLVSGRWGLFSGVVASFRTLWLVFGRCGSFCYWACCGFFCFFFCFIQLWHNLYSFNPCHAE